MLVLGIPKRDQEIVLRLEGKVIARIRHIKDEQGRVRRVGLACPSNVHITRERIQDASKKTNL